MLTSAEGFFIALKEKRFDDAWKSLTTKSRDTIVSEVYKEINKTKAKIGRELVTEDFDKNGELSRCYWDAFIKNFDPDTVLGTKHLEHRTDEGRYSYNSAQAQRI